jgi:hypothetical protein
MRSDEIAKWSSERWVCAPQRRSVATSILPNESFSSRVMVLANTTYNPAT